MYGNSVEVDGPFDDVVAQVRAALAEQGFGVISEVDMSGTLRAKIGVEIEPHTILGACNPTFASQALAVEPSIGLLLPCNVVVRAHGARTTVEMVDPAMLVEVTGNQDLAPLAAEVGQRLAAALAAVGS